MRSPYFYCDPETFIEFNFDKITDKIEIIFHKKIPDHTTQWVTSSPGKYYLEGDNMQNITMNKLEELK